VVFRLKMEITMLLDLDGNSYVVFHLKMEDPILLELDSNNYPF